MKVLVACEFSGIVRDAFRARGHDAWSCDFRPTESKKEAGFHYQGNVFHWLYDGWDMLIAHPDCTYLCNSGVRWLKDNEDRWNKMYQAALFFKAMMDAPVDKIAVENPIMHKYAVKVIGRKHNQLIQPWQFGHGETKATCLWLQNLPPLNPTNIVSGREARIHRMPPSEDRGKLRSITYQGPADAMAEQWGALK